jgi:rifampicin phosphotransferase
MILKQTDNISKFSLAGGKGLNLKKMVDAQIPVPGFIVLNDELFKSFIKKNDFEKVLKNITCPKNDSKKIESLFSQATFSPELLASIEEALISAGVNDTYLAVRSSGLDEDSKEHSFAGMFSSFLFVKGAKDIEQAIIKCFASAFSERCLEYRIKNSLPITDIGMGVVLQKMVNSEVSGVMFSRNPMNPSDRDNLIIESVYGQCEGLVSGELEADHFEISRISGDFTKKLLEKTNKYIQDPSKKGIKLVEVNSEKVNLSTLSDDLVKRVSNLGMLIEKTFNAPMDIEWAVENNNIYVVQMRPITTLPDLAFYDSQVNGARSILWDNSNIVESFAGVTTPLTFSLTKDAYAVVYKVTSRLVGVPETVINDFDYAYTNMLGFIRGRVYYNLINWYKLLLIIPGFGSNQGFMETMMGVREELTQEQQKLFNFIDEAPKYSGFKRIQVLFNLLWKFFTIKKLTSEFRVNFNRLYDEFYQVDFSKKSLHELKNYYQRWTNGITYQWKAPIVNDFLVMVFFGTLKKLVEKWVKSDVANLQNDLLCGQGDVDSTLPTLTLMNMAKSYDEHAEIKGMLENFSNDELASFIKEKPSHSFSIDITNYLTNYGFRCDNEQKLEESDLFTKPGFIFDSLRSYLRSKKYDVSKMHQNEKKLKLDAEKIVTENLSGLKLFIFNKVLTIARFAVKNRENLRFLRSRSFGINRRIFRSICQQLHLLGVTDSVEDGFYLNYTEIFDFIDGKSESLSLGKLAKVRKEEFVIYMNENDPPDRFITHGAVGVSLQRKDIIDSGDLLKNKIKISDDPNLIYGMSCCPGVVKGKVLFAGKIEDAKNLNGEILVTKRTDPGWVPLFPNCSGIIVERGSLLSHSAVIARELGVPTIVGVPGGLISKLESGKEIELNASLGEIRILE